MLNTNLIDNMFLFGINNETFDASHLKPRIKFLQDRLKDGTFEREAGQYAFLCTVPNLCKMYEPAVPFYDQLTLPERKDLALSFFEHFKEQIFDGI